MAALLRQLAEGYSVIWIVLRSRPPREKALTLSYQPASSLREDVDCGVVATYHAEMPEVSIGRWNDGEENEMDGHKM